MYVIWSNQLIGLVGRVFANGPGDLGSIPGCVIPRTLKIVLDTTSIISYISRVKWNNPGKGVALSPTLQCSSYWKGSLLVSHFYGHQLLNRLIDLVGRVFANGPGDLGSIPGHVIPKTLKMVLDISLLNTQQYKVCIKGKVEQFRERSSALPNTSVS